MKLVRLATLAGLAILSLNAGALEFSKNGGELISHKVWTTGGATGSFTSQTSDSSASAYARVDNAEGIAKSNTYVYGVHQWYVSNTDEEDKRYEVTYKLCADVAASACIYQEDQFTVHARGVVRDTSSSTVVNYFDRPGTYKSLAVTEINGEEHAHDAKNGTVDIRAGS